MGKVEVEGGSEEQMPYKNKKPCLYPFCPNLVSTGRFCPVHQYDNTKYRNSKEWKALRAQVLAEEPRCRMCGAPSTDVDHIVPVPQGSEDRGNLQGLCHACHSSKTRKEVSR